MIATNSLTRSFLSIPNLNLVPRLRFVIATHSLVPHIPFRSIALHETTYPTTRFAARTSRTTYSITQHFSYLHKSFPYQSKDFSPLHKCFAHNQRTPPFLLSKTQTDFLFKKISSARKVAKVKVKKSKKYSIFDLGTKIVFKGGPKDGAVNHDKYYYEFEERKMKKYFDKYFKKKKSSKK